MFTSNFTCVLVYFKMFRLQNFAVTILIASEIVGRCATSVGGGTRLNETGSTYNSVSDVSVMLLTRGKQMFSSLDCSKAWCCHHCSS